MSRRVQLSGAIAADGGGERGGGAPLTPSASVRPSSGRRLKTPLRVYRDGTIFGARVGLCSRLEELSPNLIYWFETLFDKFFLLCFI